MASEPAGALPLVFAHEKTPKKKFLAFSTNMTKVFADINGGFSSSGTQSTFPSTISYHGATLPDKDTPLAEYDAGYSLSRTSIDPEPRTQLEVTTPPGIVTELEGAPIFTSSFHHYPQ